MTLQIITGVISDGMTYDRIADLTSEDPADRVSLKDFFNTLGTTPDYFTEEKPLFGLPLINRKFRLNHRGAK
jgi:hypothetical protein